MKRVFALLLLLWTPSHAQVRHSIKLGHSAAYFWRTDGGFAMEEPRIWNLPSLSYTLTNDNWGAQIAYTHFINYYGPLYSMRPYRHLSSREYYAMHLDFIRTFLPTSKVEVNIGAGLTHQFKGGSLHHLYVIGDEGFDVYVDNGNRRWGCNLAGSLEYRFYKGFNIHSSLQQTRLFGATEFGNITSVNFGLGYTFGGGMNRSQRRKSAP